MTSLTELKTWPFKVFVRDQVFQHGYPGAILKFALKDYQQSICAYFFL